MTGYETLAGPAEARLEEKKSVFIAAAAPVDSEEAALGFLERVRAAHRTANHHVYAYRLRQENRQRYSDDGEPAKTAGLPVLEVLAHAGLTDSMVVVTRYFGGTLLGTGGLVRAYTAAAQAAVRAAGVRSVALLVRVSLPVSYAQYETARRLFEDAGAVLEAPVFAADVRLAASLPAGGEAPLVEALQALTRGGAPIAVSDPYLDHPAPLQES